MTNGITDMAVGGGLMGQATQGGAGVISINHPQAMAEVQRLRNIVVELNAMHRRVGEDLRDMNSVWEGVAANSFMNATTQWRMELKAIEAEINDIANLIQRIADELRDAEQRVLAAMSGG